MRHGSVWLIGAALVGAVGCGDAGNGPSGGGGDEGSRLATQFEDLADSVDGAGYSPTAEALRHAAEIVRLTGHATPVTLTIDGANRSFLAVAEQIDFPQLQCWWPAGGGSGAPPPDTVFVDPATGASLIGDGMMDPMTPDSVTTCTEVGTFSMRTLIAWEPERMAEVVRLVADVGSNEVNRGVPDVMTGLPANAAPEGAPPPRPDPATGDTTGGNGGAPGYPGFMGEYLVDEQGMWFAVEGSQTNDLDRSGGECTSDRATFDWARFRCESARFGYEFRMRVEPLGFVGPPIVPPDSTGAIPLDDPPPSPRLAPGGDHTIAMVHSVVDGVRLTVDAWVPPPVPVPEPPPEPGPPPEQGPPTPLPPDSVVSNQ